MARKTTTVVNCDNPTCKNYAEVEDLKHTPEGWYRVSQADERGNVQQVAGGFDVCSLRCVEKWSKERRLALKGLTNGRPENKSMVMLAVEALDGPTSRMIQSETGLTQNTVDKYLRELEAEGVIRAEGEPNNAVNPRKFFLKEGMTAQ